MNVYCCIQCGKTYSYDRSWQKKKPIHCGRCERIIRTEFEKKLLEGLE